MDMPTRTETWLDGSKGHTKVQNFLCSPCKCYQKEDDAFNSCRWYKKKYILYVIFQEDFIFYFLLFCIPFKVKEFVRLMRNFMLSSLQGIKNH